MMNLETELRELAQTHLDFIQDIQWHDLRRAVVIHLESMEEHDTLIIPRISTRQVCHHITTRSPVLNGQMEQPAGLHGTPSFFKSSKTVNPSGFGCHAKPYAVPTSDPAGSDTNRVNFLALTPIASGHMHPIGSTQNYGPFDGGCNMNLQPVSQPDTHSMVT